MFKPQAEHQVKTMLALKKISELENVAVSDEEIEQEYKKLAEKYNMELPKVKEFLAKDALESELTINRTIDLIRESSIAEKPKEPEKPDSDKKPDAEKKTAAEKKTTKKEKDSE